MEGAEAVAAPRAERHRGEGVVEAIGKDELTLSHGPIPSLNWGAMTMGFKRPVGGLPPEVKVGERVVFEFSTNAKGEYELAAIAPQASGQGARR
jgi:Cu(I)/Ag(I) efflux system membrane fusion protein